MKLSSGAPVAALLATAVVTVAAQPASAAQPIVRLTGDAALTSATAAARFHVHIAFTTDTPGAPRLTLTRATLWFPDHAGTNGRRFPSCSAAQIRSFGGDLSRCPRSSRIGGGTLRADALQLGVDVPGRVALFNGPGGRSITFNIQATNPALVNESIDAPLTPLHGGRYGERLTLAVPHPLQEILDGIWVGLREFDVTLTGAVRGADGTTYSYLRARTCPGWEIHHSFDFRDGTSGKTASAAADARVACRDPRRR